MLRKYFVLVSVLSLAAVAYATINITLKIEETDASRLLDMMRQWSKCHIIIEVIGSEGASDPNQQDYHAYCDITYQIPPEDPNTENQVQFGKRFIKQFMVQCVRAHEMVESRRQNILLHKAIPPADVNVPDDLIY